ncbi:fasciclin domain-containing protein, partial [Streptomyces sp. MBT61]|nr:fasciclin domain-containing protein [Streptomyces sp. MBT61]
MTAFRYRRAALALTAAAVLPLTLTACGGDERAFDAAAGRQRQREDGGGGEGE